MNTAKFKDSPLGPIPQDWEMKRLGDVVTLVTKGTTPTSIGCEFTHSGVKFLKAESIADNGSLIPSMFAYISEQTHELLRRSQLKENDILFSIAGVLGRVGIVSKEVLPANTNQALAIIRPNIDGEVDIKFLFYCLHAEYITEAINQLQVGVAQANLSLENVEGLRLALPPLSEQQRIAEALGEVDKLIESLDEQIEKKRLIAKGVAHDLLSGKKRLPGFKGEWKNVRLGDIGEIIRGVSYSPNNAHSSFVDGTIKLLRANNVQEGRIIFNDLVYVDSQCVSQEQRMLRGDILICAANGSKELVGKAASIDYDFETTFGAFMMVLRPNSEITGRFLKHYFVSHQYRNQLDDVLTGSAINNLNGKAVCKFTVALPLSLAEQQAIADLLNELDVAIAALEGKREKYVRIKEGMMRDLLSGKVRMKGE